MKALVLCAGYGTRLGDLTKTRPKVMLPISGEPLLAYTLRYLAYFGFDQVAINLHFMPDLIVNRFGDGAEFGIEIHYSYEETLLGTAGAVKRLERYFSDEEDFLVMYGDLLVDQDLSALLAFHHEKNASATLLLHRRVGSNSMVHMDGANRIVHFLERPAEGERRPASHDVWVNSGLQVLNRRMLNAIPPDQSSDLPRDVYTTVLGAKPIYGFPLSGYRCAIDSPQRYAEAQEAVATGQYRYASVTRSS